MNLTKIFGFLMGVALLICFGLCIKIDVLNAEIADLNADKIKLKVLINEQNESINEFVDEQQKKQMQMIWFLPS